MINLPIFGAWLAHFLKFFRLTNKVKKRSKTSLKTLKAMFNQL